MDNKISLLVICCVGFLQIEAIDVDFTGNWREGIGWELVCSWTFPQNDRLQSVRLSRDSAQFKIYRPEVYGPKIRETFDLPDSSLQLDCIEVEPQKGTCVLVVEILRPPTEAIPFTCEVSGERPTFNIVTKEYLLEPFVPSLDAHIDATINTKKSGRVKLNCTATGLPAPKMKWTVGQQKVAGDFTGKIWNTTTKLNHVWSSLTLTPNAKEDIMVTCTPEQSTEKGLMVGPPVEYLLKYLDFNSASTLNDFYRITTILVILYVFVCVR